MKLSEKISKSRYVEFLFSLICGFSYFIIAMDFIVSNTNIGGLLLAMFVAPVIVCGIALIFIKLIRNWREQGQFKTMNSFVIAHIIIFVISLIFAADLVIKFIS